MLFNSYIFIFLFLPITLFFFYFLGARGYARGAIVWLVIASLFFYGWWNPAYSWLILSSLVFNFSLGRYLTHSTHRHHLTRKGILIVGVCLNLFVLGYYKYANFFLDNLIYLTGINADLEPILLPLAISFFTFQQIAYLVDTYQGEAKEYDFLQYSLFVTFFPQLIAGPIVHHKEMMPQFMHHRIYRLDAEKISIGLTIFFIGLFKKVVIADNIALYATPVFDAAAVGQQPLFIESWIAALSYTFQLYFDFSGYSDMAIGLARMFGIILPVNFASPYKAVNITDFWRRWHITLSRFLRDYLYIPLGGNRKGPVRRHVNLFLTMLLGGLWHGAGWTFVLWGMLHGIYLIINHAWHQTRLWFGHDLSHPGTWWGRLVARGITMLAVIVSWVLFRAESLDAALLILNSMIGGNGFWFIEIDYFALLWLIALLAATWFLPNTQQIMRNFEPGLGADLNRDKDSVVWPSWDYRHRWAIYTAILGLIALLSLNQVSEFLYFQF